MTDSDDDLLGRLAHYREGELSPEDHVQLVQDTLAILTRLMEEKERLGLKNTSGHERVKAGLERALAVKPTLH
jgi:hypothetical protein